MNKLNYIKKRIQMNWQLYVLLALPILYVIIFKYVPMAGVTLAFKDFKMKLGIWGSEWVGIENFVRFFESYQFRRVFSNTIILSLYTLLAGFPLPIIFALILNCVKDGPFKKFAQTTVTMPHFISTTVIVGMLFQLLDSRTGLYGAIYEAINGVYPSNIFAEAGAFRHLYVWSGIWKGFGWGSIIYLASLSSVDPSYHEAAQIDGASRFQRVRYIDFPTIVPTIVTMLILRMGSVISLGFEKAYLMQNSFNISTSDIIATYQYSVSIASSSADFSYGTAIGLFNNVIELVLVIIVNKISRKVSETSLW